MGAQLLVYSLSTGHLIANQTVFSAGVHVHGIHSLQISQGCLLAVHGDRFVQVREEQIALARL